MDTTTLNHISLCAGYGGIDLGLKRAVPSLRTIAFSEIEAFPCANLVAKMEAGLLDPAPVWTDLRTFPFAEFHGLVDIVSGGFPCQPFSSAGKRGADEDPRHLFPAILDGIRAAQPALVFLENVEGIISAKLAGDGWRDPAGTPVLLHVLRELERVGYRATAGVFSASEVGAPHQRKRVFILAYRNDARLQGLRRECGHGQGGGEEQAVGGRGDVWPSRPGQPQFGWEPPRVVADSLRKQPQRGRDAGQLESPAGIEQGEAWKRERGRDAAGDQSETRVIGKLDHTAGGGRNGIGHGSGADVGTRAEAENVGPEAKDSGAGDGSQTVLGNAQSGQSGQSGAGDGRGGAGGTGEVVGNAQSERPAARRSEHEGQQGESCSTSAGGGLGDTASGARFGATPRRAGHATFADESLGNANCGGQPSGVHTRSGAKADGRGQSDAESADGRQAEPTLGGDSNGSACGLGDAELFVSSDNRTDELRLLGNGVVPAVAERAFNVLFEQLVSP